MFGLAKVGSLVALAITILPSLLYLTGTIPHDAAKWCTFIGTLLWFIVTPLWMGRELPVDAAEVEI